MTYQALFEPAPTGGYIITFPDLDCGYTEGKDMEEGMSMAIEFAQLALGELIKEGKLIPKAKKYRGKHYHPVILPALTIIKVELYRALLESGVRKAELARRAGIPKANVDRLFNLRYNTSLPMLQSAFQALGRRIVIGSVAANIQ